LAVPTVIVVGPPPDQIGGMSTVVRQMLAMDFAVRYDVAFLPFTAAVGAEESLLGRTVRHIVQTGLLSSRIRASSASIVHFHTCSGFSFYRTVADMVIARRRGCRTVLHVHGGGFEAFYAGQPRWRRRIIRWALSAADRVVALSAGWHEKLRQIAPKAHVAVIENAVEIPESVRTAQPDETCRFLLLAGMDDWKGVDDLLCACREMRGAEAPIEVVLAGPSGTAGDETVLNEKIRAGNLEGIVRYVGAVQGEEKADLLAWADIYVQPSHYEGMPIAMLEALANGLPVIATGVGAVPEVIEDGRHGVIVPPRRPDALARAMYDLALDPDRRVVMSHAARTLAEERFSLSRFRDDLMSLYDSLITSADGFTHCTRASCYPQSFQPERRCGPAQSRKLPVTHVSEM
jgi:glycosyltransferase involved in cell wall biosynthesis